MLGALAIPLLALALGCGEAPSADTPVFTTTPKPKPSAGAIAVTPAVPARTPPGATAPPTPPPGPAGPASTPIPVPPADPPPAGVHPAGSLYPALAHGYDASYPQCSDQALPRAATFAVAGVNGGKAFTPNPCLGAQWRAAPSSKRSLYLNSGYNPSNDGFVEGGCRQVSTRLQGTPEEQQAYAIGCQEAVYSERYVQAQGAGPPAVWWLDVESSNSWDDRDFNLNRAALQGEIDQLWATGIPVGIYSSFGEWDVLMGSWQPERVTADWVAGRFPARICSNPGFTGHAVWLAQEIATWPGTGYDSDYAC